MNRKKVALVTGGSRGIGKAIVLELVSSNYYVYFTYNSNLEGSMQMCQEYGDDKIHAHKLNMENKKDASELITIIKEKHGHLDLFVNNAGTTKDMLFPMMPEDSWNKVIDVNFKGIFHITQAVSKMMISKRKGSIIIISSVSGLYGQAGQTNYAASKGALISFGKSLGKELAKYNIRVNCISPGFIETNMTMKLGYNSKKNIEKLIPLKKMGRPEDVAKLANFIGSDSASYITCTNIVIDGGLT